MQTFVPACLPKRYKCAPDVELGITCAGGETDP